MSEKERERERERGDGENEEPREEMQTGAVWEWWETTTATKRMGGRK